MGASTSPGFPSSRRGTGRLAPKTCRPLSAPGEGSSGRRRAVLPPSPVCLNNWRRQRQRAMAKSRLQGAEEEPKTTPRWSISEALRSAPSWGLAKQERNLPKVRYQLRPIYREMTINGNNYKVVSVANWMRTHPGRTLEDYDRVHVARLEGMARFWRNHRRTDRQEAIAQRRYALTVVSLPSPLRCTISVVMTNHVRRITPLVVALGAKM
uniref:Uncharacterized protein n=1 Tax=Oryza punctata TaxID=4537 RepID=A0A0E0LBM4_ORYPU